MKNVYSFLFSLLFVFAAFTASAQQPKISGIFSGAQENPAITSTGKGAVEGIFDPFSRILAFRIDFSNLMGNVTAAHFHTGKVGENGGVTLDLVGLGFPTGVKSGSFVKVVTLTPEQATSLAAGRLYINIHTSVAAGGEVRAQVGYAIPSVTAHKKVVGVFSGAQENPAIASPAKGTFDGIFDPFSRVLAFRIEFSGLLGKTAAAHFHTGALGTNGGVTLDLVGLGFPTGVTSGEMVKTITLTPQQATDLMAGKIYANIHTAVAAGGEIRAQLNFNPSLASTFVANPTENTDIAVANRAIQTLSLAPNPARESVTLRTDNFAGKSVEISIYNVSGQLIQTTQVGNMDVQYTLGLYNVQKGLYIVRVASENQSAVQKLIVE
jgi:CHRD domain/Secretion system C-terminal sorting domain